MIYSMTGYANKVFQASNFTLQVDIRSVNQRFLDISIKCAEELKIFEHQIREKITAAIRRGKVDLRIHIQEQISANNELNFEVLNHYTQIASQIKQYIPQAQLTDITQIINLPGVLSSTVTDVGLLKESLFDEISLLINELQASQAVEGNKLESILNDKLEKMGKIIFQAQQSMLTIRHSYKDKLKQKLMEALGEAINNETRFQQEFAYYCQKIDVDEELSRLLAHIKMFQDILKAGGQVGKRLDFLTQEMHREANTFGAKSAALETTVQAVELKVLIEQVKEQVQNIM